jgi:hypothetical protein
MDAQDIEIVQSKVGNLFIYSWYDSIIRQYLLTSSDLVIVTPVKRELKQGC